MGRYYQGDIEGKFWFGVQSSDDGEFFGAKEHEPSSIDYYVEDIEPVKKGVRICKQTLGDDKRRLEAFFDSLEHGYNEKMIINFYMDKYGMPIDGKYVQRVLKWFARLELGEKILKVMKEKGHCEFNAEL